MIYDFIYKRVIENIDFEPLEGQDNLIKKISEFAVNHDLDKGLFLLKGYAGTGKTSIIAAFINALDTLKIKSILLAPTGRAAKVLTQYSKKEAFTIHKKIYRQKSANDAFGKFLLDKNLHSNTFFIVDEASMIANQSFENSVFGSGRLLDDLIEYVYSGNNCKLILVGDTAQLPPVRLNISPALDRKELVSYGLDVVEHELTEVVRQAQDSGILLNATKIRNVINSFSTINSKISLNDFPKIELLGFNDIEKINGTDLIEKISDAYGEFSESDTVIICRSNKRANRYNQGIRNMVLFREEEITVGDLVMIVKNNYFWSEKYKEIDFIANGDTAEVVKIHGYIERYDLRFADVTLLFKDYNNLEIKAKIILDTLYSESPALTSQQNKEFYYKVEADFAEIRSRKKKFEKIKKHPFFNALQVKYAYAVTCHKAQGGQWKKVFVDQGWLPDERIDIEYLRWLYTAFTRPVKELSLVNFRKDFFYT